MKLFTENIFLASLFTVVVLSGCNADNTTTVINKSNGKEKQNIEGYIILTQQVFENVDQAGMPVNPLPEDHDLYSPQRTMYLHGHFLTDILLNRNFKDGKYVSTDTIGYKFYDLWRRQFFQFDKLEKTARTQKHGLMKTDGSFSDAVEVDPLNKVNLSSFKFTDTVLDDHKRILARFIAEDDRGKQYASRIKFWIDDSVKNFPLQVSYLFSRKMNNSFIYKMQLPTSDGVGVMITEFRYQPGKLSEKLVSVFEEWERRFDNY